MTLATNKHAYYNYEILETFTAGIILNGAEVKSVKKARVDLKGSFADVEQNEVWLKNVYIAPYAPAKRQQEHYDPHQNRKLLLTAKEIKYLIGKTAIKGVTLVPLKIFNKKGLIKVELSLAKGKRKQDKRETIKKREFDRKKAKLMKNI